MYELEDIKRIRKKMGLTQSELAKLAQVSQSLIAKIESSRLDPAYSKVKGIFLVLEDIQKKEQLIASQIMNSKIISIESKAEIKEAISLMKKHQISQMPVIDGNQTAGLISESTILDAVMGSKSKLVKDIMTEAPPVVSKNSNVSLISTLLRHCQMVLVSDQGSLVGVITKSDLLGKAYKG